MRKWIRSLFTPKVQSLNWAELKHDALVHNYIYLQSLVPDDLLIPVLKSNAYGHGLREVCQILRMLQPQMVAVDSYPEYQIVRDQLESDILIIGEMDHSVYRHLDSKRAVLAIYRIDTLKHLIKLGKAWKIHLFLNTGMNREGIQLDQLEECCRLCQGSSIQLEGVMSHLTYGDHHDRSLITIQYERFKSMYDIILSYGFSPFYRHINNSAGLLQGEDEFWTAHRIGLALYGYNPLTDGHPSFDRGTALQPVMSVRSRIIALHRLSQGETVGYDGTYIAQDGDIVATIPFGYNEGLRRAVSSLWSITHAGGQLDCAGRISMNLSSWVAGDAVQLDDEVCVISDQIDDPNSFLALARMSDTIIYEVLVRVVSTMRKVIV